MVSVQFRVRLLESYHVLLHLNVVAMDLKRINDRVKTNGRTLTTERRREERQKNLDEWQIRWNTASIDP